MLSGLLLASSPATEDSILGIMKRRAELVLLKEPQTSPLCRDGEVASRLLWRLTAKVLGKLAEHFEKSSQDPGGWAFYRTLSSYSLKTLDERVLWWRSVYC